MEWDEKKRIEWDSYKGSAAWYKLKELALKRSNHRCEGDGCCCNTTNLQLHHDTYPDHPSEDSINNVRILCAECHEIEHFCIGCGEMLTGEDYRLKQDIGKGLCFECYCEEQD